MSDLPDLNEDAILTLETDIKEMKDRVAKLEEKLKFFVEDQALKIAELKEEVARIEILATGKAVIVPEGKGVFWTNKITELEKWNEKAKKNLGKVLSKLFRKVFTLNRNALVNSRLTKEGIEKEAMEFIGILNKENEFQKQINKLKSMLKAIRDQFVCHLLDDHNYDRFDPIIKQFDKLELSGEIELLKPKELKDTHRANFLNAVTYSKPDDEPKEVPNGWLSEIVKYFGKTPEETVKWIKEHYPKPDDEPENIGLKEMRKAGLNVVSTPEELENLISSKKAEPEDTIYTNIEGIRKFRKKVEMELIANLEKRIEHWINVIKDSSPANIQFNRTYILGVLNDLKGKVRLNE